MITTHEADKEAWDKAEIDRKKASDKMKEDLEKM